MFPWSRRPRTLISGLASAPAALTAIGGRRVISSLALALLAGVGFAVATCGQAYAQEGLLAYVSRLGSVNVSALRTNAGGTLTAVTTTINVGAAVNMPPCAATRHSRT